MGYLLFLRFSLYIEIFSILQAFHMLSVNPARSDMDSEAFVEVDPTGRYGCYRELLGNDAVKNVYRAFDQEEGIEVAWNQVKLRFFSDNPSMIGRLYSDVRLLRKKHKQVSMKVLKKWSKQILKGLNYLHSHEPCIIHRDLNCSNVFVNRNTSQGKKKGKER
ncbi:hypothetical protein GQ457_03G022020 [Hibiscus cannabinus]